MGRNISLDEQKKIILDMMDYVNEYCEKNNICYFLAYGTLLGAIRHKGFIPWDDDFDIIMPREDYVRFIEEFNNYSDRYRVLDYTNNSCYYYPFAKIVDSYTVLEEKGVSSQLELGVYIDIFPLDKCGDSKKTAYDRITKKNKKWNRLNTIKLLDKKKKRSFIKQICVVILKLVTRIIPWSYVLKKMNDVAMIYNDSGKAKYSAPNVVITSKQEILKTDLFQVKGKIVFEKSHFYNFPVGYDEILKSWYGDYMQLPPVQERVFPHNYDAYWKEEIPSNVE